MILFVHHESFLTTMCDFDQEYEQTTVLAEFCY